MKENRVLTIDNLTTTFESHKQKIQAVRGVSLHVDEGDILAIVGESGSGKSVTMKSVMGLLGENADVQADHLELLQKDLLSMSEKEKRKMRGKDIPGSDDCPEPAEKDRVSYDRGTPTSSEPEQGRSKKSSHRYAGKGRNPVGRKPDGSVSP